LYIPSDWEVLNVTAATAAELQTLPLVDGFSMPDPRVAGIIKPADIRYQRKPIIDGTDWMVASDSPLTSDQQAEAITYRKALRDITKQDPNTAVWPTPPVYPT
jgi:hypothetical protein